MIFFALSKIILLLQCEVRRLYGGLRADRTGGERGVRGNTPF